MVSYEGQAGQAIWLSASYPKWEFCILNNKWLKAVVSFHMVVIMLDEMGNRFLADLKPTAVLFMEQKIPEGC